MNLTGKSTSELIYMQVDLREVIDAQEKMQRAGYSTPKLSRYWDEYFEVCTELKRRQGAHNSTVVVNQLDLGLELWHIPASDQYARKVASTTQDFAGVEAVAGWVEEKTGSTSFTLNSRSGVSLTISKVPGTGDWS